MLTFLLGFFLAVSLFEAVLLWKAPRREKKETAVNAAESLVDQGFENIMRFTVGGENDA